jgi:MoaA/NifB/PqqE/SkfB family radical SAM enzyme
MSAVQIIKTLARKVLAGDAPLQFPDTINIETSYACNLHCVMCPRHFEGTPQGTLSLEVFRERILPVLGRFNYVHLTGWGEPLVHPKIAEIVRLSKSAGCWVCFTTNGLLLKSTLVQELLEAEIDLVNISIDGATADTYERVRGKGAFTKALERAREFDTARRNSTKNRPTLQWTYVMMKSNLEELPAAVELAGAYGFDRFIAKHLESALSREGLSEALFDTGIADPLTPEENSRYDAVLQKARETASRAGLDLEVHPRKYAIDGMCLVRPLRSIFVDWRGVVSPCCYLNRLDVKPYIENPPSDDGLLGSVEDVSLVDLLTGTRYGKFQRQWAAGQVPEACRGCLQVNRMHAKE